MYLWLYGFKDESVEEWQITDGTFDQREDYIDNRVLIMSVGGKDAYARGFFFDFVETHDFCYEMMDEGFDEHWEISKEKIEKLMIIISQSNCAHPPEESDEEEETDWEYQEEMLGYLTTAWERIVFHAKKVMCHAAL